MTHISSVPHMPAEFEAFLFAPIGEDGHGIPLSVLSTLARLDIDPWQEAAKLAGLPKAAATRRLTWLIAALPDGASTARDPPMIAARLIKLLPHRALSQTQTRATELETGAAIKSRAALFVILLVLVLGVQYLLANHQPPAPVDNARTPVSDTTPAPMPPPRSGR